VDTLGLLLAITVHSAGIQDRVGARAVLLRLHRRFPRLVLIWADGAYTGQLVTWTKAFFGWTLAITKRSDASKFTVIPKRWIVERTFGWWTNYRRLAKDYEHSPKTAETVVKITMIGIMAKRLT
jgi:putative transposase